MEGREIAEKEAIRLEREGLQLLEASPSRASLAAYATVVNFKREAFGSDHPEFLTSVDLLIEMYEIFQDFKSARIALSWALSPPSQIPLDLETGEVPSLSESVKRFVSPQ